MKEKILVYMSLNQCCVFSQIRNQSDILCRIQEKLYKLIHFPYGIVKQSLMDTLANFS